VVVSLALGAFGGEVGGLPHSLQDRRRRGPTALGTTQRFEVHRPPPRRSCVAWPQPAWWRSSLGRSRMRSLKSIGASIRTQP